VRRPKGAADEANCAMLQLFNERNWEAVQRRLANDEWDANRPLVFALQPGGYYLLSGAVEAGHVALTKQ
jgi:hypothetical protein